MLLTGFYRLPLFSNFLFIIVRICFVGVTILTNYFNVFLVKSKNVLVPLNVNLYCRDPNSLSCIIKETSFIHAGSAILI